MLSIDGEGQIKTFDTAKEIEITEIEPAQMLDSKSQHWKQ